MFDIFAFGCGIAVVFLYLTNALVLSAGLRFWKKSNYIQKNWLPKVTIILPARNEEQDLPKSLERLIQIDYPAELLEIVVVDDGSSDRTFEIASGFTAHCASMRVVKVRETTAGLNGKANALECGVRQSTGEIIFITDADCRVPAGWIRAHLRFYKQNTGMVGGVTLLTEKGKTASLFAHLQSLDWLYLCAVGSGAAALNLPLSVFGNNFSFRRKAYEEVGGFKGAGFSVIEDFALMRAMQKLTNWKIALPAVPEIVVQSLPAKTLKQFYHQRKRWVLGGRQVSAAGFVLLLIGALGKIVPFIALFWGDLKTGLAFLGIVLAADAFVSLNAALQLRRMDQLKGLPLFFPFTAAYSILFLRVFLFSRSVRWRGRKYKLDQR